MHENDLAEYIAQNTFSLNGGNFPTQSKCTFPPLESSKYECVHWYRINMLWKHRGDVFIIPIQIEFDRSQVSLKVLLADYTVDFFIDTFLIRSDLYAWHVL